MKVALIIIYNHRYDKNISIIEKIYKERFKNIYHLVPFYDGDKENVIPVYENSYYFQGYVAQGFKSYFKEEYSHYFYVADDMVLNPVINEDNYHLHFRITEKDSFIPRLSSLPEGESYWMHNCNAISYTPYLNGLELKNILPTEKEALHKMSFFNIENNSFKYRQVYKFSFKGIAEFFINKFSKDAKLKGTKYPLARSYSDIFILSKNVISKFIQYCGAFAASNLFVELAIPTSLIMSTNNIVVQNDLNYKGGALWTKDDLKILDSYNNDLKLLLDNFPQSLTYLHPIKLSKWNTKNI